MKLLQKFKVLLLLSMAIVFANCSKNDPDNGYTPEVNPPQVDGTITIPSSENVTPVLGTEGGTVSVAFSATNNWTAAVSNDRAGDWVSVSPTSGTKGNASITISVTPNDTPDERNATIVLKCGSASKNITVTQKQKDAIIVTTSKYELPKEGGNIEVEVKANIDFEVIVPESSKHWIKESTTKTRTLSSRKLLFTVDANEDTEKREGEIVVKSGSLADTIHVYQDADDKVILLSRNEYLLNEQHQTIKVELKSNCSYNIIMPDVHWIKESAGTRAMSTHTLYYDISPNHGKTNRSAEIVFIDTEAMVSDTLHIVQVKKGALLITKEKYSMSDKGGEFDVEYNTNNECSIFIPPTNGWLSAEEVSVSGATSKKLRIKVEANEHSYNRTGIVVIKEVGTNQTDTVCVQQAQQAELRKFAKISQKEFRFSYENTKLEFEIISNCELKININKEFRSFLKRSTLSWSWRDAVCNNRVTLEIDINNTSSERSGEIYILSRDDETPLDTVRVIHMPQEVVITSMNNYTISDKAGSFDIDYRTEFDCNIAVSDSWIRVNNTSTRAFADKKMHVDIAANTTSQNRKGSIVLTQKDGNLSDTINITQVSDGILTIPKKEYEVSEMPEEFDIEYSSNLDLISDVPAEYDWIDTVYIANAKVHVKVSANNANRVREGFVILKEYTGALSDTVKVKQARCEYYLDVPGHDENIQGIAYYKGGLYDLTVLSNGSYKFEIEGIDEEPTWIHYVRTEKESDNRFAELFYVDENNTGRERKCYLKVSLGNIARKYTFVQAEKRELFFSQESFNISSEGGRFPLEIKAGGSWAANKVEFWRYNILKEASSWISVEKNENSNHGSTTDIATIVVHPNLTNESRSTSILFYSFQGEEYYINVTQSGQGAIVISPLSNYILSSKSHSITLDMATANYSVEIDNSASNWISLGKKSGDGEKIQQEILIKENTTANERKGNVTFISGSSKNQISFTQLMPPPALIDDTPAKWKQFTLPAVDFVMTNPQSEGSRIYQAIVPDCEDLIAISSRKVLDCLYNDPNNSLIPRLDKLRYLLEDFDGISYKSGGGKNVEIGLSNQYLASYYKEHGAEAMIKENIGILTHELTHAYQGEPKNCGGYTAGTHYFAFIEGVADAVRVLCGGFPNESDRPKGGNYMDGYRVTGFFLAWLVNNKDADFLRKFNESAHNLETWTFEAGIKYALGDKYDAQELWIEYQKAMGDIK